MRAPSVDCHCRHCNDITPHDIDKDQNEVYCLWCKASEPCTAVDPPRIPLLREERFRHEL